MRKFLSPEDTQHSRRPALPHQTMTYFQCAPPIAFRCPGLQLGLSKHLVVEGVSGPADGQNGGKEQGAPDEKEDLPQSPLGK